MNAAFTRSSQPQKPPVEPTSKVRQFGGMMIESLIGLLILSVIGGGVMHATARMTNTQQQQTVNNITVNQMRAMLTNRTTSSGADLCATGSNPKVKLPGQTEEAAVVVKGCSNVNMQITNVQTGGTTLGAQTVSSMRPVVLEVGTEANKVRIGGVEVRDATAP